MYFGIVLRQSVSRPVSQQCNKLILLFCHFEITLQKFFFRFFLRGCVCAHHEFDWVLYWFIQWFSIDRRAYLSSPSDLGAEVTLMCNTEQTEPQVTDTDFHCCYFEPLHIRFVPSCDNHLFRKQTIKTAINRMEIGFCSRCTASLEFQVYLEKKNKTTSSYKHLSNQHTHSSTHSSLCSHPLTRVNYSGVFFYCLFLSCK